MTDRNHEADKSLLAEEPASAAPSASERGEAAEAMRIDGPGAVAGSVQDRPDPLKLFRAQWERNKPAFEFLGGP